MRHLVIILTFVCVLSGPASAQGQEVRLVSLTQFQELLKAESQHIQVVNFWATWCAPCLKEMPLFEKLRADHPEVKVRLVSMDMDLDPNPDKVRAFVKRKKLASEVLILDERNPNEWIEKIDKKWTGALPATLVIHNKTGKRIFVEKELHEGDLEKLLSQISE